MARREEKRELTVQIRMRERGLAGAMGASEPDASEDVRTLWRGRLMNGSARKMISWTREYGNSSTLFIYAIVSASQFPEENCVPVLLILLVASLSVGTILWLFLLSSASLVIKSPSRTKVRARSAY